MKCKKMRRDLHKVGGHCRQNFGRNGQKRFGAEDDGHLLRGVDRTVMQDVVAGAADQDVRQ